MNADTKTLEQRATNDPQVVAEALAYLEGSKSLVLRFYGEAIRNHVAALSSAAEAKGVEYDRSVLYDMLGDYAGYHEVADCLPPDFSAEAIEYQRKLLRAADEADAEGVRTACRSEPAQCTTCSPEGVFDTEGNGPFDCYACGKKATGNKPAASAVPDYALLQRYVRNIHVPVMHMGKACIQRESVIKAVDRWIASAPSPETEGEA